MSNSERNEMIRDIEESLEDAGFETEVGEERASSPIRAPMGTVSNTMCYDREDYEREEWHVLLSEYLAQARHDLRKKIGNLDGDIFIGRRRAKVAMNTAYDRAEILIYRSYRDLEIEETEKGVNFRLPPAVSEKTTKSRIKIPKNTEEGEKLGRSED